MTDFAFRSAVELAEDVRERRIGCVELLELHLARVGRFNPALNAIVVLDAERARLRAKAADEALARGEVWGRLHGVPMTIKEAFDVAGLPTTWGLEELRDNRPAKNALVVDRLLQAGAVLFGKTNVPVRLGDCQTFNPVYGTTNNPWNLGRTPGGSSGGAAAALATGLAALEAGSDIGGSIRNPAHYCGVYGHKPTYGIVPQRGHAMPDWQAPPDINVCGPMARSADDLAEALEVMAGPDVFDAPAWRLELPPPRKEALREFRVALMPNDPVCDVDAEVQERVQAVADAVAGAGATVSDRARPDIDTRRSHALFLRLLRGVTHSTLPDEQFEVFRRLAEQASPDDDSYPAHVARGATQLHRAWFKANEERERLRFRWAEFFQDHDVLLCPAASSTAFPHDHAGDRADRKIIVNGREQLSVDQLFWAGLSGVALLPSTVAPAGLGRASGLPVGVQIVGPYLGDRTTIRFARLLAEQIGGFVPPPGYA